MVAVYDTYGELTEEYAKTFGCLPVYNITDFPPVDGVIIDSINNLHIKYASYFLTRNIPVFIDKPLSHDIDEALSFVEDQRGKPWFSTSPLRFSPLYTRFARDVQADGSGLQYCRISVFHTMEHFMRDSRKRWHDDPLLGGGMLVDIGIHAVELLNLVIPHKPIASVNYLRSSSHYTKSLSHDNHHIEIEYGAGVCASIDVLCATSHLDYTVEAYTLEKRYVNSNESPYVQGDWTAMNAYGGFEGTIEAFLEMVETKQPPIPHDETKNNFLLLQHIIG